jgi:hypothetical protein
MKQKDRPIGPVFCSSTLFAFLRRSKVLVGGAGCLVYRILGGFLGVADGLLAFAFDLLNGAFAPQPVGTNGVADALLCLANGFVGGAFDLILCCTHGNSPSID